MESFNFIKSVVLNFRIDNCCWVFPVKVGLILTCFFNAAMAITSLLATAHSSFPTILIQIQTKLNKDAVTRTVPYIVYITELVFDVLGVCAIFRKDLVLLRVYMYYCVAALVLSIMVYSLVILAIDWLTQVIMIIAIVFQIYVLLLVRSAIVEIKWEKKQTELPTLVMSSLVEKETKEHVSIASEDPKDEPKDDDIPEITVEIVSDEPLNNDSENATEAELETKKKENSHKKETEPKLETVKEEVSP